MWVTDFDDSTPYVLQCHVLEFQSTKLSNGALLLLLLDSRAYTNLCTCMRMPWPHRRVILTTTIDICCAGASFAFQFDNAGTFSVFDALYPHMSATEVAKSHRPASSLTSLIILNPSRVQCSVHIPVTLFNNQCFHFGHQVKVSPQSTAPGLDDLEHYLKQWQTQADAERHKQLHNSMGKVKSRAAKFSAYLSSQTHALHSARQPLGSFASLKSGEYLLWQEKLVAWPYS